MIAKLLLVSTLLLHPAGALHYQKTVDVKCGENTASQVVTYVFSQPVETALAVATPVKGGNGVVSRIINPNARTVKLTITFTHFSKGGEYTGIVDGWIGKEAHYSPRFRFYVIVQPWSSCFKTVLPKPKES